MGLCTPARVGGRHNLGRPSNFDRASPQDYPVQQDYLRAYGFRQGQESDFLAGAVYFMHLFGISREQLIQE